MTANATKASKAQLEVLALDETCEKCSVAPGAKCISQVPGQPSRELKHPHPERIAAAEARLTSAPDIDAAAAKLAAEMSDAKGSDAETEAGTDAELHPNCVECGYEFKRPQRKSKCQVKAACDKRKAAKTATA